MAKPASNSGMIKMKKRTLWSSKNSVSQKPLKRRKPRNEFSSHSPRGGDKHVYFEYSTPLKHKKSKLGSTHDFSTSQFQSSSYTTLGNFNQQFSESKRVPKEFRIQRSSRSKGSKTKFRPPLYTTFGKTGEISTKLLR